MTLRDTFFVYEILRKAFLFGLRTRPIFQMVDARPGERILDAGCGFGELSKHFKDCDYVGVDLDGDRITWAKKNIGETPTRRFLTADISKTGLESKSFDKILAYGLLHHLSDEQAQACLKEFSRICRGRIVFSDPVYSRFHWINNILCRLDRGAFVRNREGYLKLCSRTLLLQKQRCFYAHNALAKYFLSAFIPHPERTI